jgi:hypothetical protein
MPPKSDAPLAPSRLELGLRERIAPERGRRPLGCDGACAEIERLFACDFRAARARAGFSRGHLLDVVLELPGGRGGERERDAAELLSEFVLGEARAEDWLGSVSLVPAPRGGALRVVQSRPGSQQFFPLSELSPAFDAAITGLYAGLPREPLWAAGGEQRWVMLELDVERRDEYPAQSDVVLATTFLPEMLKSFLSGLNFASARFSRNGELFAYLKTLRADGDVEQALAERRVLEDALDAALVGERCGRVVGSGMGVVHSYVDFALDSLDRAVDVIRAVARRVGLPRASWLLFCDTLLADEWIALVPGAPLPPGAG